MGSLRNAFQVAATLAELAYFRRAAWRLYQPAAPVAVQAFGQSWQLRPGLTFTPFANAVGCTAHCAFCSEELQRYDGHRRTAKRLIDDYPAYFARLAAVLRPFRGRPLGLSLSGLEATVEPRWLRELLACLTQLEGKGLIFDEKVLYTNGSGLATSPDLGLALQAFSLDRLELARCHDDEVVNQQIMRFNRNQPMRRNAVYAATVRCLSCCTNWLGSRAFLRLRLNLVGRLNKLMTKAGSIRARALGVVPPAQRARPTASRARPNRTIIRPSKTSPLHQARVCRIKSKRFASMRGGRKKEMAGRRALAGTILSHHRWGGSGLAVKGSGAR